jgi:ATP-dependent Clp protease adaptor protein ClpS
MTLLSPDVDERTTTDERTSTRADTPWVTVVWDDPVNLMSYVTYVFQQHFGFSRAQAERLMHQVNDDGRAIVATGPRESMEAHVQSMHGYGLQATVDKAPEA